MLFVIIPLIIFFAVFLWLWISDGEPGFGFVFGLLSALGSVLVVLLLSLCFAGAPLEVVDTETYEIHALADNMQYEGKVSGSIFLVQSRVDEELKYNYMYMVEGKGFGFKSANASSCYLNYLEDADATPYVTVNRYDWNEFLRWAFGTGWGYTEYIFYLLPDAEVIDDFTIDFN